MFLRTTHSDSHAPTTLSTLMSHLFRRVYDDVTKQSETRITNTERAHDDAIAPCVLFCLRPQRVGQAFVVASNFGRRESFSCNSSPPCSPAGPAFYRVHACIRWRKLPVESRPSGKKKSRDTVYFRPSGVPSVCGALYSITVVDCPRKQAKPCIQVSAGNKMCAHLSLQHCLEFGGRGWRVSVCGILLWRL